MNKLILATSNKGKIIELQNLLPNFNCISQQSLNIPDADETGLSFIENSLIKARHASQIGGMPALADDSGLVVPILGGEPGIYSARYAGATACSKDNIDLLLSRLTEIQKEQRGAYFYCAISYVEHAKDPTPLIALGKFSGEISLKPIGKQGFGYDPIFYLTNYKCSLAELPIEIKNKISHRGQALEKLKSMLNR
ncbi:MAG: RdgB/HAM1 family non-canonical purine NTP pyrophosphatase [Legionellaceae bacterium]|nr:RdgB/HAM1 family non-canonical purine NTP pyrophosphatase [Legionellaceae bacterium]